ncbi:phosphohydrolase [Aquincola sp. S2]|uniref:Phosphohydrolase n=1 Tax=Pseudaquabacterium terrae TaxID=2732868 RepID=A0ABX2EC62_9BURK|nr:HD domain-containing phosphohydrolase [Aquabacterium terrae]NRF66756.1 phosphohydrolase [Aquabacterium terrae]
MASQLLRLVSSQLKVGAALPFGVRDEHGKLLLARGQVIDNEQQLAALMARGLYADQEEVKAYKEGRSKEADNAGGRRRTLFDLWEQSAWHLDRLLKSIDEPDFPARCDEFATLQMDLVQRDVDIAIFLSVRQDPRRLPLYGLTHALNTALVCQLMGQRVGWEPGAVRSLVKAALTMNLTISELQGRIATMGRITDPQREQVRAHPQAAADKLRAAGVDDPRWLEAVQQHHERKGPGGYPQQLTNIAETAIALRMADVFIAKISARTDRPALSIQDAARQMFAEAGGSPLASAIIKEYGIFPPGNVVQLVSGEQAVVIRRGGTALTPLAAAITDKSGTPTVTTMRRDTGQPGYAIKGAVTDTSLVQRVPPERLYGLAE